MIVCVSTVKDTLANIQRYVDGNLRGGADHLVVFLDAGDREVRDWLDAHPHVTCIRTDASWWHGERPAELNVRQRVNVNLVKALLAGLGGAEWVFHIDADEVVQLDRTVLAGVPVHQQRVRLTPWEAVSQRSMPDGTVPTRFKTLLGKADLALLDTLGVIDRPANEALFHGHVEGKSGVRPGLDRWLTLHHGVDAADEELDPHEHESLRVLHYESYSGEDFVRKWTGILSAGPNTKFRPARNKTALALRALIGKDLDEATAQKYLMRIFEETTLDDAETLEELGLLRTADPAAGTHEPQADPAAVAALQAAIEVAREHPKQVFHPGGPVKDAAKIVKAATGTKL